MENYVELLSKISESGRKLQLGTQVSDYNVFDILEVNAKEVIMCRFLADLLNPEGRHGYGILFLKSFMHDLLKEDSVSDLSLAHTDVVKEFVIDHERRIDIVIQNPCFFIPIEVKIYAGEQEGQCYDYYQYARNAKMVYLTRFGDVPSEYSRKKKNGTDILPMENIQCISWADDIYGWLEKLTVQLEQPVKSAVQQYMDAIHAVVDERYKKMMDSSLNILYESPDYFLAGIEIERSMKMAKANLMRLMFDDFREEMEKIAPKYGLEAEKEYHYYTYEEKCNEKFYDGNTTTCPGLNYIVRNAEFHPENIRMWFRIEVEYNLFAGLTIFDTEADAGDGSEKGCEVDEITEQIVKQAAEYVNKDIITPVNWWLTWCYANGKRQDGYYDDVPDFKNMNACAIQLVDRQNRKRFVKGAVENFENHILRYLLHV